MILFCLEFFNLSSKCTAPGGYRIRYIRIVALGTSTCCQLKNFLPSKRRGLLQHTVDIEVSALAKLALYENSLIRQEISVCCPH